MMNNLLPKSCLKEIQRLQINFIWGDSHSGRKVHVVKWKTITMPKENGGLRLRDLSAMNHACILKLAWQLIIGAEDLWCILLRGLYKDV
ncbi:unnamed protein product [Lathyrus sativus]|nr:unnamed protein product [Lathyrus sativus]